MSSQSAMENRPDNRYEPVDNDPGVQGRIDERELDGVTAADPRWLKLGIAAAFGAAVVGALVETRAAERPRHC